MCDVLIKKALVNQTACTVFNHNYDAVMSKVKEKQPVDNLKRPSDIKDLFDISHQTVRRWSEEFEQYLSTNATPPAGQMRLFTEDDVSVFSLVAQVKNNGGTYEDAHARLRAGERGDIPDKPPSEQQKQIVMSQLAIQNKELRQQVESLTQQRDLFEEETRELRDKVIRLETRLEEAEKRIAEFKDESRDDLLMEIGKLKALLEMAKQNKS